MSATVTPRSRAVDPIDAIAGAGFLIMTAGIALLSVAWSLIIAGALLLSLGLAGVIRRGLRRMS